MAISKEVYLKSGKTSFCLAEGNSDAGQQFNINCQKEGILLKFLWPTHCEHSFWEASNGTKWGTGMTFEDMLYHQGAIRLGGKMEKDFIKKCKKILGEI